MANPFVVWRANVVEVRQLLLSHELPQNIDIAVGHLVRGKDVVIRDDYDLAPVPDLGVLAEMLLENAKCARTAYIVSHKNIGIDPDIVTRLNVFTAGMASKD